MGRVHEEKKIIQDKMTETMMVSTLRFGKMQETTRDCRFFLVGDSETDEQMWSIRYVRV